jgi:hypothetical protein
LLKLLQHPVPRELSLSYPLLLGKLLLLIGVPPVLLWQQAVM